MTDTRIDGTQRFLCAQHRQNLENNPDQAAATWNRLIISARQKTTNNHWQQAANVYACALEVADIIFQHTPNKHTADRYIKTVIELSYTLRHCHTATSLSPLVQKAKYQLKRYLLTDYSNDLLQPILDVAFSPMIKVNQWMKTFFHLESTQPFMLH